MNVAWTAERPSSSSDPSHSSVRGKSEMMWPATRCITMNGAPIQDTSASMTGSATGSPTLAAAACAAAWVRRS